VRVIAGRERGRRLLCPAGLRVRPTADRVKEALFNILQERIRGARVLDLFAGTGALGIEALSRGASWAVFVDNHPASLAAIRANLNQCRFNAEARVIKCDALAFLERGVYPYGPYDLIFADPPYRRNFAEALLEKITPAVMALDGILALEHARDEEVPERAGAMVRVRSERYGDTVLSFYRLNTL
jgi:16S rRNA (guanine(966)-N(2))-methyltransferase RsmD